MSIASSILEPGQWHNSLLAETATLQTYVDAITNLGERDEAAEALAKMLTDIRVGIEQDKRFQVVETLDTLIEIAYQDTQHYRDSRNAFRDALTREASTGEQSQIEKGGAE